jgi:hypothetical protein
MKGDLQRGEGVESPHGPGSLEGRLRPRRGSHSILRVAVELEGEVWHKRKPGLRVELDRDGPADAAAGARDAECLRSKPPAGRCG